MGRCKTWEGGACQERGFNVFQRVNLKVTNVTPPCPCRHHDLEICQRGAFGKKHPVFCKWCGKHFEGRNRARIWQHVASQDHRARFMKGKAEGGNELKKEEKVRGFQETILNSSCLRVTKGKCSGLRLNSVLGQKTRLGSVSRLIHS